jgi:non-specific serine/threonine protein kinase
MCWQILGSLTRRQGALRDAELDYERSLAFARDANDSIQEAWAAYLVAYAWYELGDAGAVRAAVTGTTLQARAATGIPRVWARVLRLKAWLASLDGDHVSAAALEEESLALFQTLGDQQGLAFGHLESARRALGRSDRRRAARHLLATLTIGRDTGDQLAVTQGLEGLGELLTTIDPNQAMLLLGAAEGVRERYGLARTPLDAARLASIGNQLPASADSPARESSERGSLSETIESALASVDAAEAMPGEGSERSESILTRREKQVALLLARGLSNRDLAVELAISDGTARIHTEHILSKLGLRSRAQVADWARLHGILPDA